MQIKSKIIVKKMLIFPEYATAQYTHENKTGIIAAAQVCGAASWKQSEGERGE